jgi:hypothetical protein
MAVPGYGGGASVVNSVGVSAGGGLVLGAIIGTSLAYLAARWRVVNEDEELGC